jgi:hypothetical protein
VLRMVSPTQAIVGYSPRSGKGKERSSFSTSRPKNRQVRIA